MNAAVNAEARAWRGIFVLVAIVVPAFGLVSLQARPEMDPIFPFRFGVSLLCLAMVGWSYKSPFVARHLRHVTALIGAALFLVFAYRGVVAGMPVSHAVGLFVIVSVIMTAVRTRLEAFILLMYTLVTTGCLYQTLGDPSALSLGMLLTSFATVGTTVALLTLSRIELEARLANLNAELEQRVRERTAELSQEVDTRRAAEEMALQASRAKSSFLANMSHELRTPLNAILGYTELVQDELTDRAEPDVVEDLERVRVSTHHLLRMVSDVLDLSRIEAGKLSVDRKELRILPLLEDIREVALAQHPTGALPIELDAFPSDLTFRTDAGRLTQIVLNLLTNAQKFSDKGVIRLSAELDGAELVVQVADQGPGIPPEQLESVFGTFVQLDASTTRVHGGAGLGLALSRDLSKRLGGSLTAQSELGVGTTFFVRLPEPVTQPSYD